MIRRDYIIPEPPKTFSGALFCIMLGVLDTFLFFFLLAKVLWR